eukprot:5629094-Prymnesium_polylepis.1
MRAQHARVGHLPVVGDRMDALAVGAVGAVADARRTGRQVHVALARCGPARVAGDLGVGRRAEGGRDVVLARVGLGPVVVARQ